MAKHGFSKLGLHHGKATRPGRKRDGVSWPADGGAAVTPAQTKGYTKTAGGGGTVKAKTRPSKKGKGGHTSPKK